MDMDTTFLSILVSPIYPGHRCNFNEISFVIKFFKIKGKKLIKLMLSVFGKFGEILKQAVLAEVKKLGIKLSIIDKEIGYELRCTAPIAYDIDYARSLGFSAVQFLMAGDSGAIITIQDNKAVPMRFEDIKDPETGKTKVRKVNTGSIHYQIARGLMMRLEPGDLDDPGLANAYRMDLVEFKQHYGYLFEEGTKEDKKPAKK